MYEWLNLCEHSYISYCFLQNARCGSVKASGTNDSGTAMQSCDVLAGMKHWVILRVRPLGWRILKVPPLKVGAAALQLCNLRNQAVMQAATVSDYAQEILGALCSKQFTLTWAQREHGGGDKRAVLTRFLLLGHQIIIIIIIVIMIIIILTSRCVY